jgi:hypothetical protein
LTHFITSSAVACNSLAATKLATSPGRVWAFTGLTVRWLDFEALQFRFDGVSVKIESLFI